MKKHLSVYGIGPVYGGSVAVITGLALAADHFQKLPWYRSPMWETWGKILGIILIAAGIGLWVHAVIVMKLQKNIRENHLITTGVYGFVRNPVYTAIMFALWGILCCNGNLYLLVLCPVYYGLMTILVKKTEEKWLTELYGDAYVEYCRKVNRCIPWFPKKREP